MSQEIENLRQLSAQYSTMSSLAQKRERQHGLLGEQLGQGSITRDVRIAEVMERTLDRWGKVTERAESLGHTLSEETERVDAQLRRLRELGTRNSTVRAIYEPYQAEFDAWRTPTQTPEPTTILPEQPTAVTKDSGIKPAEREKPKKAKRRQYEVNMPDGSIYPTFSKTDFKVLKRIEAGGATKSILAIDTYGADTQQTRNNVSASIARSRRGLLGKGWKIVNDGEHGSGAYGFEHVREPQIPADQPIQLPLEEPQPVLGIPGAKVPDVAGATAKDKDGEKQAKVKHRRILPNGVEIEISEGRSLVILDLIEQGIVSSGELAFRAYGEDNPVNKNRIVATIGGHLNNILRGAGLRLKNTVSRSDLNRGVPSHFVFEDISQKAGVETKPRTTPKPAAASQTALGLAEVIEVPYVPTPDEIRSTEEKKIVDVIVSMLTKSSQINFPLLQRALKTEERFRRLHEEGMYRPYQAEELRKQFESGLRKLREESAAENLRRGWDDDDLRVWEEIQRQVYRLTGANDFEEYIRMVKKLIDRGERELWGSGKTPVWIKVPAEWSNHESK